MLIAKFTVFFIDYILLLKDIYLNIIVAWKYQMLYIDFLTLYQMFLHWFYTIMKRNKVNNSNKINKKNNNSNLKSLNTKKNPHIQYLQPMLE